MMIRMMMCVYKDNENDDDVFLH